MITQEQFQLQALIRDGKIPAKSIQFASDIASKSLTSYKQREWVTKLVRQYSQEKLDLNLSNVVEMMENAKRHLKYPKINLQFADGKTFRLKASSKHTGVYIDGGSFQSEYFEYFGKITPEGKAYLQQSEYKDELELILNAFSQDLTKSARDYGLLTGNCCFCLSPLSDERSTEMGYGPICADHYNLNWGNKIRRSS